jgi:hypothetical protein
MRELRARAEGLIENFGRDLRPFLKNDQTFHRLPNRDVTPGVSVTTTCTCLMAGAAVNRMKEIYPSESISRAVRAFSAAVEYDWKSSGLDDDNSFTTVLVLRAAGLLRKHGVITKAQIKTLRHKGLALGDFAERIAGRMPESFQVADYPPKSAIAYWFVDAVEPLGARVSPKRWERLANWASREFSAQLSYVTARHDALQDPVAMIMAACLVERMRKMAKRGGLTNEVAKALVPGVELRHGIEELFRCQSDSGIWQKYFPLFHYKDAGANYCFHFEFLEAVLSEFGDSDNKVFELESVLGGLEQVISWCEQNRFVYRLDEDEFSGWNSGGQIHTLRDGIPESWATATVHMFLYKLCDVLSEAIADAITKQYAGPQRTVSWEKIIDIDATVSGIPTTVKETIRREMTDPLKDMGRTDLRHKTIAGRCSALMFGPPGTSKTTFARAVATQLKWPFIEINPSHFLSNGLEQIYVRTDEIFRDLMDLSAVVVLFDEMDALVESRSHEQGEERLDAVRQLLTTSMLPKLAALRESARIVFFMATNHRRGLDQAITRSGRFDLLLCVGPPTWMAKVANLGALYKIGAKDVAPNEVRASKTLLAKFLPARSSARRKLDMFTFAEVKIFIEYLIRVSKKPILSKALISLGQDQFLKEVEYWANEKVALREQVTAADGKPTANPVFEEYLADREASALQ